MKYQGKITDPKDLVTKEYVDPKAAIANPALAGTEKNLQGLQVGSTKYVAPQIRPNLLDNWYFVGGGSQLGSGIFPINQLGQAAYPGSGYTIDRWKKGSDGTVTVSANGVTVAGSSSSKNFWSSDLVKPVPNGSVCTFSALAADGTLYKATSTINTSSQFNCSFNHANGVGRIEYGYRALLTGSANKSGTWVAAKFEIGDTQTLCHNEGTEANPVWVLNEIPDYNTELRKCQVYQPFIGRTDRTFSPVAVGIVDTTTVARLFINLPASPIKAPKSHITFSGNLTLRQYYNGNLSYHTISAVTADSWSESMITAYAATTGLTVGAFCDAFLESGSLQIDCNL